MPTTQMAIHARDLSCQALAYVDSAALVFHGQRGEGYAEELNRRGEIHVLGCDLIGHLCRDTPHNTRRTR